MFFEHVWSTFLGRIVQYQINLIPQLSFVTPCNVLQLNVPPMATLGIVCIGVLYK